MRRSPEIIVLIVLLLVGMASVLWYVIDRRAKMHASPPVAANPAGPAGPTSGESVPPVDLTRHDGQTIDFSSGQPEVKDSPEDKAALEATAKEMAEAVKEVTFQAPKKKTEPPPAEPKN